MPLDWADALPDAHTSVKAQKATNCLPESRWKLHAVLYRRCVVVDISGASVSSVDLLPNPHLDSSWTKDLPTDDGQESDQIFAFDGRTTAIEVPSSKLDFALGESFTLSTWMKHAASHSEDEVDFAKFGRKEHILCHSDGDGNAAVIVSRLVGHEDVACCYRCSVVCVLVSLSVGHNCEENWVPALW